MNKEQYISEVNSLKAPEALKGKILLQANQSKLPKRKWISVAACAAALIVIAVPVLVSMQRMGNSMDSAADFNLYSAEENAYEYKADSIASNDDGLAVKEYSASNESVPKEKTFDEVAEYYQLPFKESNLPYSLHIAENSYPFSYYNNHIVDDSVHIKLENGSQTVILHLAKVGTVYCYPTEAVFAATVSGMDVYSYADENGKTAYRVEISDDAVTEMITLQGFEFEQIKTVLNAII